MAITDEQIKAITQPTKLNLGDAVSKAFENAMKHAGSAAPKYIVTNAAVKAQYEDMMKSSAYTHLTDQEIEDHIFYKSQAHNAGGHDWVTEEYQKQQIYKQVQAQIAEAQKWPHFAELEPLILEILNQWPHASLEKAYQKALELKEKEEKYKANLGKIYWTPTLQQEKLYELKDLKFKGIPLMPKEQFKVPPHYVKNMGDYDLVVPKSGPPNTPPPPKPSVGTWSDVVPMSTNEKIMWTGGEAGPLIQNLQKASRKFNYHLCLGGSVLNKGYSTKDLDLYYLPLNDKEAPQPKKLIASLAKDFGVPEPIGKSAEYPEQNYPYIAKLKFDLNKAEFPVNKRIDVFVLGVGPFDIDDCLAEIAKGGPLNFVAKIIHRKRSKK